MAISIKTSVILGDDDVSKQLEAMLKNGEKIFWIKDVFIKECKDERHRPTNT